MSIHPSNTGFQVKDPVATAYPGKVPEDVGEVHEGDVTTERMPASAILDGIFH